MIKNYKKLPDQGFPGFLAGSQQPGYKVKTPKQDLQLLKTLEKAGDLGGKSEQYFLALGVDKQLIDHLKYIHEQGITRIYSLADYHNDRNPTLVKMVWESMYPGSSYVLELSGIKTEIQDFTTPTMEQCDAISRDAIQHMKNGENVLVHCGYGAGRTGTMLAAIYSAIHQEVKYEQAIQYIRDNYNHEAVETDPQQLSVKSFRIVGQLISKGGDIKGEDLQYAIDKKITLYGKSALEVAILNNKTIDGMNASEWAEKITIPGQSVDMQPPSDSKSIPTPAISQIESAQTADTQLQANSNQEGVQEGMATSHTKLTFMQRVINVLSLIINVITYPVQKLFSADKRPEIQHPSHIQTGQSLAKHDESVDLQAETPISKQSQGLHVTKLYKQKSDGISR